MTIKKLKEVNFKDFKLFVASCSTGNVGQLTADLLINSLNMEKCAMFSNPGIIPMLGPSAYDLNSKELSVASEFFISESNKILVLLIRSPTTSHFTQHICEEIVNFIKSEGISEIIQLSSAFSFEQHHVQQSPFEYLANLHYKVSENLSSNFNKTVHSKIPGCGISVKLHDIATDNNIPSVILFKYVSEGDNMFDAMQFANLLNKSIGSPIKETAGKLDLKVPVSWKHLFGHGPNLEIY